jgi:peptidoglycan/LPS O-acetylase OafA/YrhL
MATLKWVLIGLDPQWGVIGLNLASMFWGALFRQWHDAPDADVRLGRTSVRVGTLLAGTTFAIATPLVVLLVRHRHAEAMPALWGHLAGLGLFAATVLLLRRVPRPIAWLGVISYSVYLLHPVVMYSLWRVAASDDSGFARLGIAPLLLLTMACAVAAAALSYYALEKPAIALGRRLTRQRQ